MAQLSRHLACPVKVGRDGRVLLQTDQNWSMGSCPVSSATMKQGIAAVHAVMFQPFNALNSKRSAEDECSI